MESVQIMINVTSERVLPKYQTKQSAGMDLVADIEEPITLKPLERKIIPTGIRIALPSHLEAQVRPRSGLAFKEGITVLNSPGTIDADYRGEIGVILINLSDTIKTIQPFDRIAQLVIAPFVHAHLTVTDNLDTTGRGAGGFGSTGM